MGIKRVLKTIFFICRKIMSFKEYLNLNALLKDDMILFVEESVV